MVPGSMPMSMRLPFALLIMVVASYEIGRAALARRSVLRDLRAKMIGGARSSRLALRSRRGAVERSPPLRGSSRRDRLVELLLAVLSPRHRCSDRKSVV